MKVLVNSSVLFLTFLTSLAHAAGEEAVIAYTYVGKGDKGFNDAAFIGLQKAEKELGVKIREIEPRNEKALLKAIEKAEKEIKFVVFIGFPFAQTVEGLAKKYPDKKFVIVDAEVKATNVASYLFKEHEGSYLAGYIAGKTTKSGTVGFLGGMPIPPLKRFESGYMQGVQAANSKTKVLVDYLDPNMSDFTVWNDPVKGKSRARDLYSKNADIVYVAAGASGLGVFDAAAETQRFSIGVDSNQNGEKPGHVLTSMVKRVDTAGFRAFESFKKGTFTAKAIHLGIKEDGVGLAIDEHTKKLVPGPVLKEIYEVESKLKSGKIAVKE